MYCPNCGKKTSGVDGDDWDNEQVCENGHKWKVYWVAGLMTIMGDYL